MGVPLGSRMGALQSLPDVDDVVDQPWFRLLMCSAFLQPAELMALQQTCRRLRDDNEEAWGLWCHARGYPQTLREGVAARRAVAAIGISI